MDMKLQPEETELLKSIITNYLSDLFVEISNTEDYDMREGMKRDEAAAKGLLSRLNEKRAVA